MKKNIPKNRILLVLSIALMSNNLVLGQETKTFESLKEVLIFAKEKNNSFKNKALELKIAGLSKKVAIANIFNPKINTTAQAIDNQKQAVNFLPAQVFGGAPGDFRAVTMGQQYISTVSVQPQFDILNLANIATIKTASINQKLVENKNKIYEQNLYNQINSIYFSILSFEAQKEILEENIVISKDIVRITTQKYTEGIVPKQELNEAEVQLIAIENKLQQLEFNIKTQYQILDLFFENEVKSTLIESVWRFNGLHEKLKVKNSLSTESAILESKLAHQEYRSLQFQKLPVLSFVSSFNWQNLSNDSFFHEDSKNQNFNYIGLKLSLDILNTNRFLNTRTKKYQLETLRNNEKHIQKENKQQNTLQEIAYEKALLQADNYNQIYLLKKDTYEKNYNQFKENILPLDKLLISQNDMLISKLNLATTLATIGYNKNSIEINNNF